MSTSNLSVGTFQNLPPGDLIIWQAAQILNMSPQGIKGSLGQASFQNTREVIESVSRLGERVRHSLFLSQSAALHLHIFFDKKYPLLALNNITQSIVQAKSADIYNGAKLWKGSFGIKPVGLTVKYVFIVALQNILLAMLTQLFGSQANLESQYFNRPSLDEAEQVQDLQAFGRKVFEGVITKVLATPNFAEFKRQFSAQYRYSDWVSRLSRFNVLARDTYESDLVNKYLRSNDFSINLIGLENVIGYPPLKPLGTPEFIRELITQTVVKASLNDVRRQTGLNDILSEILTLNVVRNTLNPAETNLTDLAGPGAVKKIVDQVQALYDRQRPTDAIGQAQMFLIGIIPDKTERNAVISLALQGVTSSDQQAVKDALTRYAGRLFVSKASRRPIEEIGTLPTLSYSAATELINQNYTPLDQEIRTVIVQPAKTSPSGYIFSGKENELFYDFYNSRVVLKQRKGKEPFITFSRDSGDYTSVVPSVSMTDPQSFNVTKENVKEVLNEAINLQEQHVQKIMQLLNVNEYRAKELLELAAEESPKETIEQQTERIVRYFFLENLFQKLDKDYGICRDGADRKVGEIMQLIDYQEISQLKEVERQATLGFALEFHSDILAMKYDEDPDTIAALLLQIGNVQTESEVLAAVKQLDAQLESAIEREAATVNV